jgi:hypothetical protein
VRRRSRYGARGAMARRGALVGNDVGGKTPILELIFPFAAMDCQP